MPGELGHAAFGRDIAEQDAEPAARLDRIGNGADDFLAGGLGRAFEVREKIVAGDGRRVDDQPRLHQAPAEQGRSSSRAHVGCHEPPARLEVGDHRRRPRNLVEHVEPELVLADSRFARDRQQMEDEIGRARRRGAGHRSVAQAIGRDQAAGVAAGGDRLDQNTPGLGRRLGLVGMDCGHVVEADRGEAEEGHRQRHRVGGELPAARAGAGAGGLLHLEQPGIVERADAVRADRLEHVLDGDRLATEPTRHD